jgi:hypothetical protein
MNGDLVAVKLGRLLYCFIANVLIDVTADQLFIPFQAKKEWRVVLQHLHELIQEQTETCQSTRRELIEIDIGEWFALYYRFGGSVSQMHYLTFISLAEVPSWAMSFVFLALKSLFRL